MMIAHLPAGYLLTKLMSTKFDQQREAGLWVCALMASIMPDIDILWLYLTGGVTNHRYYPTHWPSLWLGFFLAASITLVLMKKRALIIYPAVIVANALFHLTLDAVTGPIFYFAPFFWEKVQLVKVPAIYDWWVWNFLRHWSFQWEMMIWATAALVYGLSGRAEKTNARKTNV